MSFNNTTNSVNQGSFNQPEVLVDSKLGTGASPSSGIHTGNIERVNKKPSLPIADDLLSPESQVPENKSLITISLFGGKLTILELFVLVIYPFALLLGGTMQFFDGASPSYFSNKRNLINVLLVKRGWFWVTVMTSYHSFMIYSRKSPQSMVALRNIAIRYILATSWWIFFAQWFFGVPLMDKIFLITGGKCLDVGVEKYSTTQVSSAQCKSIGGKWVGGYDPSGHTFLLVHSSLYIWMEILPYIHKYYETLARKPVGSATNKESEEPLLSSLFMKISLGFLAIYWWMLLMTGVYFHSFFEKFAGMIWGYIGTTAVFVLANVPYIPALQQYLSVVVL